MSTKSECNQQQYNNILVKIPEIYNFYLINIDFQRRIQ